MTFIRAGVIGHPIKHSKSPIIHGHWIDRYGLQGSYEAIDIPPAELAARVRRLVAEGYAGFNVTIPHKEEIFKLCDDVDEKARIIGAVNTVKIDGGKLYGTNTDAFGFIENIKQNAPSFDFCRGKAVVIGAGGAARAILYGLLKEGVPRIVLTNRTREKSEILSRMAPGKIVVADWADREGILEDAHLIVNTTALGMTGKDPLELSLSMAPVDALVTDIVYAPLETELLRAAKQRGHQTVTGIGMLLHQARPAFSIWFGVMPDVTEDLQQKVLG